MTRPCDIYEIQQAAAKRDEELRQLDIEHMEHYTASNKAIHDRLSELLGHTNLYPLQKPHFMDDKGHLLLNSLYLYPWYCILRVYFSYHVRWFLKAMAWSVWLICVVVLFFVLRDSVSLQKQKEKNKYVHVYFSDNEEVMMELEGIDIMFSDVEVKPVPINDYREYMKERKKALKDKAKGKKRK